MDLILEIREEKNQMGQIAFAAMQRWKSDRAGRPVTEALLYLSKE